jgi:hypothetical protein
MADVQTLLRTIDQLEPDELEQVHAHVEERRRSLQQQENASAKVVALRAALAEFRDGLTQAEWAEISQAMNAESVEPEDLEQFDWLDNLPEDER